MLILLQSDQQLPEPLLPSPRRSTFRTLAAEVHQLSNTLPACSSGRSVLPVGEKLLRFLASLGSSLFFLGVVVLVEVVDGLLGIFDCFGLFLFRNLSSVLQCCVSTFAPLPRSAC